jgi:hypothetical protein
LAERWNGTKWSIEQTPDPAGSSSYLTGVSCVSASACTAVGYYLKYHFGVSSEVTLAERWNGTKWSIEHTPREPTGGSSGRLFGVSCVSASACTAVGEGRLTLAERWNGTKWSIEHTPSATRSSPNELPGVSCASAKACTAIGDYYYTRSSDASFAAITSAPFAERWNGTR